MACAELTEMSRHSFYSKGISNQARDTNMKPIVTAISIPVYRRCSWNIKKELSFLQVITEEAILELSRHGGNFHVQGLAQDRG